MEYNTNVGLVDTHAKSVGCYHHTNLVFLPFTLSLVLDDGIETCMVEGGTDASLTKQFCYFLGATSTAGIDDGAAFHTLKDMDELLPFIGGTPHNIGEVLALEAHLEDVEVSRARYTRFSRYTRISRITKLVLDILDDLGRSCGGERQDWDTRQVLADIGYLEIGRAEVIAPL